MQVDPKVTFYLGLATTIALVLSHGTIWAGALPDWLITPVSAWNNIIGVIGTAVMTMLTGVSSSAPGPITKLVRGG